MKHVQRIFMCLWLIAASCQLHAQQIEVKGSVADPAGEPIIGATIMEKGSKNGAITDIDGNFKLKADAKAMLEVSYIGYETQTVKAAPTLNIVLNEVASQLNEVVVTGYTTQRKADLTGAISVVSVSELAKQNE